jgi:DNA-binding CsgD family transcriptional regulator/tetratricopeptide (TPR) repeat protein
MLTTATKSLQSFDGAEFERLLRAADFERCHAYVDGQTVPDALLASARLALRERRYLAVIGLLSDFSGEYEDQSIARDVLLGAALGYTRDFVAGVRLIDRALANLLPEDAAFDEAHYYKSAIAWMQHDHAGAEESVNIQLRSNDANNRARAHIMQSWIAVRRGDVRQQVDELQKALDEIEKADSPDEYFRANALFTLALLCRELSLPDTADRVRHVYETMAWTSGLGLERFQVTRFLAGLNELQGNHLAAFREFKQAARFAPSEHWSLFCYLDRAALAKNTGENVFASEQLHEAHEIAQRLSWTDVAGEERSALLVLAELFADENPGLSEMYLARFRTLGNSVVPILSYGTDPRVRGFQSYSQGMAWLRLGDTRQGEASLSEAWGIFDEFDYGWRAALCAVALFEATGDRRWMERAATKIAQWPNSWIAKRVSEAKAPTVVPIETITPAKREVLELVRDGRRNADIAKKLGRSPNTVRNQISQLFQTFDVKSRTELAAVLSQPVVPITRLKPAKHLKG